jgi:cytochrome b6-f complex iron-sulfur subunit
MLFGIATLGFRFLQFLLPTEARRESETVLIGAESRIRLEKPCPGSWRRKILV